MATKGKESLPVFRAGSEALCSHSPNWAAGSPPSHLWELHYFLYAGSLPDTSLQSFFPLCSLLSFVVWVFSRC